MIDLDEQQKVCDAATPPPWVMGPPGCRFNFAIVSDADIEFTDNARNLMPDLLRELRAAREVVEAANEACDVMSEDWPARPITRRLTEALASYDTARGKERT